MIQRPALRNPRQRLAGAPAASGTRPSPHCACLPTRHKPQMAAFLTTQNGATRRPCCYVAANMPGAHAWHTCLARIACTPTLTLSYEFALAAMHNAPPEPALICSPLPPSPRAALACSTSQLLCAAGVPLRRPRSQALRARAGTPAAPQPLLWVPCRPCGSLTSGSTPCCGVGCLCGCW